MKPVDLQTIQQWTGARVVGNSAGIWASGLSTDSRTVRPGELFVALRGETFDGHRFVSEALNRGAVAALVEAAWLESHSDVAAQTLMAVPSTLAALADIAREYRRGFAIPVVGVTGSAGKTTAKEMMAAVLGQRYCVLSNRGNENNEIGVPNTLLQLDDRHEIAVLELAARKAGDIGYLCAIAQPTMGVLLNVGNAHLEFFGSVERVAKTKGELLGYLRESSTALINVDDCVVVKEAKRTKGRLFGFSIRRESEFRGERLVFDQEGCGRFSLQNTSFHLRVPGRHNVYNALAAVGVGHLSGVTLPACAAALETFQPVTMRSHLRRHRGWMLLDDSYNANPESVRAALDVVGSIQAARRIAVLGDMLELGRAGPELHAGIGRDVVSAGVDRLFTTGSLSRHTAAAAVAAGLADAAVQHCQTLSDLENKLHAVLQAGDIVLVKGSRAMQLEQVVDSMLHW